MRVAVLDDYQDVASSAADWDALTGRAEVRFFHDHVQTDDEVVARLSGYDVVVMMRERTPITGATIARLPDLRLIVTTGMWNASLDVKAARKRGVAVVGTTGGGPDTAELAWLLIMTVWRGLVKEVDEVRNGGWQATLGRRLRGATLGLLGLGVIGSQVAAFANAFGMSVLAWSQNLTSERANAEGARYVSRQGLFDHSDIVSIHLKLSGRTRGLVGCEELALLGPGGYLVNTSRGPIVVESDLIEALKSGTIGGAGLDTFESEPLPLDHPFRCNPRVVLTPHVGYVTRENYQEMFSQVVEDIIAWLDGLPIREIS